MNETSLQLARQRQIRTTLRIAGPALIGLGLLLALIGLVNFFMAFGGMEPPRYFWCTFLGMPLLFFGVVLSHFGYMGAIFRFVAGENAPVAKDAFNYMGTNVRPGIKAMTSAVAEGLREKPGSGESDRADA